MERHEQARRNAAPSAPARVLFCVLIALVAWLPSLARSGFSFDDREVLEGNPIVAGALGPAAAFERDYWEHIGRAGHYRPIAALSLRLDHALYGARPLGFHLTNVVLHALCVALAGVVLLLMGGGSRASPFPWFGLALFAAHPVLADSVAWVSGRTSMLSALGVTAAAAWLAHLCIPWRPLNLSRAVQAALASAVGLLASLLSKEDALVLAPVLVLVSLRHSRRLAAWTTGGCTLALVAYMALRWKVYGELLPSAPHAPLHDSAWLDRLAFGGRALVEAARLLVAPIGYPPNYERAEMFSSGTPFVLGAFGWLLLLCSAVVAALVLRRRRSSRAALSTLLCAFSVLPWMQIAPAGALFAPRFLYLPLLLAIPALSAALRTLAGRFETSLGLVVLAGCCVGAWSRSAVYADRESYWSEQVRHTPDDARAYNELGLAREERDDLDGARANYSRAIELDPDYGRPWSNLGRLASEAGDLVQAEQALRRATDLGPGNAIAWSNLGAVLLRLERWSAASEAYLRAVRNAAGLAPAWRGLGRARLESGDLVGAREAVDRALALDPTDERARALGARIDARPDARLESKTERN